VLGTVEHIKMEWRPYLEVFVPNTFREFVSKHGLDTNPQNQPIHDLLPYKPSARDVEVEQERLAQLKRKVAKQRLNIKLHDQRAIMKTPNMKDLPSCLSALPPRKIRTSSVDEKGSLFVLTALSALHVTEETTGKPKGRRLSTLIA
jgi:hypothetical protein